MSAEDTFKGYVPGIESPATDGEAVTPSDTLDLAKVSRALYVGTGGTLKVTLASGTDLTFSAIAAGWHPLRVSRVWATGTSATDLVAVS